MQVACFLSAAVLHKGYSFYAYCSNVIKEFQYYPDSRTDYIKVERMNTFTAATIICAEKCTIFILAVRKQRRAWIYRFVLIHPQASRHF